MQHGGWMAEPRRGAHLNEDAPAQPHADVRTSQPVATSGSDQAIGVGLERERIQRAGVCKHGTIRTVLAMTLASLMALPLVSRSSRCRSSHLGRRWLA